jgi:hypothetical protein
MAGLVIVRFHKQAMISPRSLLIFLAAILLPCGVFGADRSAFDTVRSAGQFAIGGVGAAGITSPAELALRIIRDGPKADEQLRKLLREGTPAGQMYALFGLRQIDVVDYAALAQPYCRSTTPVQVMSGCILHTDPTSEVVQWIDQWAMKMKTWEKT